MVKLSPCDGQLSVFKILRNCYLCRKLHGTGLMTSNQQLMKWYLEGSLALSFIWWLLFWR